MEGFFFLLIFPDKLYLIDNLCVTWFARFLARLWHIRRRTNNSNNKKRLNYDDYVSFGFLCVVGVACYWFFFKCVDWFEKI